MSKVNINAWKNDQREILRAAFGPAFIKYTEMVNQVHEPDDYRKYLEFIAKQVGLEEPTLKTGPHDGLTTVQINIGAFHQSARAVSSAPFSVRSTEDVEDVGVLEPMRDLAHAVMDPRPISDGVARGYEGTYPEQVTYSEPYPAAPAHVMVPGLAAQLAADVLEVEPDTLDVLDQLLAQS